MKTQTLIAIPDAEGNAQVFVETFKMLGFTMLKRVVEQEKAFRFMRDLKVQAYLDGQVHESGIIPGEPITYDASDSFYQVEREPTYLYHTLINGVKDFKPMYAFQAGRLPA